MGIRTKEFVFAAIDSKTTTIIGREVSQESEQPKIYTLTNYYISFATIGRVLCSGPLRVGAELTSRFNSNGITKSYEEIIKEIANEYKNAYARQVNDGYTSITVILGYDPKSRETFLYECKSPDFEPQLIPINKAVFYGSRAEEYKQEGIKVFRRLKGNCLKRIFKKQNKINLQIWAKQTFDSINDNPNVGYPLLLCLYSKNGNPIYNGDAIYDKKNISLRDAFNVNLKFMF
ncbi:hypothetical protein H839_08244 [Parageobacillus genomosp. 1]|uniref:Uncharacterized protein n=2 Tax=Parageobacillus genomosp. 1 TaxID=1295642 RepID=A0ABC9VGH4_9BACL|nr:hypothetical protein H839_08244 [Parageobacillus genomosp. 1]